MASTNKHFDYAIRYTYSDKRKLTMQGTVSCSSIHDALRIISDDEGCGWEEKRASKEILYIIKVP